MIAGRVQIRGWMGGTVCVGGGGGVGVDLSTAVGCGVKVASVSRVGFTGTVSPADGKQAVNRQMHMIPASNFFIFIAILYCQQAHASQFSIRPLADTATFINRPCSCLTPVR
ncbi:MAG: hypothetical protein HC804_01360 [Anaerolineae bacterium]|nr:hypothetical protein [Anaerolineae bacterium]